MAFSVYVLGLFSKNQIKNSHAVSFIFEILENDNTMLCVRTYVLIGTYVVVLKLNMHAISGTVFFFANVVVYVLRTHYLCLLTAKLKLFYTEY